jgi:RimJ/RimL family protein N-acetyltransferase
MRPFIRRLPAIRVPGYFNTWPTMVVEFADRVGREPEQMRLPPPSPSAITRMEQTMEWLRWLEGQDAKLVWARVDRTPWKGICARFGISRATANRRYQYAVSLIAWRLNGRSGLSKRSRAFVTQQVRSSSSM